MTQSSAPQPDAPGPSIVETLRAHIVELSDGELVTEKVDPSAHFFDYGYLSSLTAVMFLEFVEDHYGVQIDDLDLVQRLTSLELLAAEIERLG